MSKSLNNAIFLADSEEEVKSKVMSAVTDPGRIRATDPGNPDICTVFHYHDAFNTEEVEEIEDNCRQGTIGCVDCKNKLAQKINSFLQPMRERRAKYLDKPELIREILISGTEQAKSEGEETLKKVREVMKIDYFKGKNI
jgi:tryptophanyl-tRNA synthetase